MAGAESVTHTPAARITVGEASGQVKALETWESGGTPRSQNSASRCWSEAAAAGTRLSLLGLLREAAGGVGRRAEEGSPGVGARPGVCSDHDEAAVVLVLNRHQELLLMLMLRWHLASLQHHIC